MSSRPWPPKVHRMDGLFHHIATFLMPELYNSEENLAGTAREARAFINATSASELGVVDGDHLVISTDRGSITVPVTITQAADRSVSVARNSINSQIINALGIVGGEVSVSKA